MRYVPVGCLREGMLLGKNLYSPGGNLLLAQDQMMTQKTIGAIHQLGYQGVYITDSLSGDIEIQNVIKDELRQKTVEAVRNVYIYSNSKNPERVYDSLETSKNLVSEMVDEILTNQSLMINMVDLKVFSDYTFNHSVNTAVLAVLLGVALDYSYYGLLRLGLGALLHDIGKVFIPNELLDKRGKLDEEEMETIRTHPRAGYDYLVNNSIFPSECYTTVLQHHERYNGTGYPYGLKSKQISQNGRVVAVADVYDAMISSRPYRKALFPAEVMEYIVGGSTTMFDPNVVKVFVKKVAPYPVGTIVRLSNGEKAIVIKNYENFGSRPAVRIFEERGSEKYPVKEISLRDDFTYLNVTITEILEE